MKLLLSWIRLQFHSTGFWEEVLKSIFFDFSYHYVYFDESVVIGLTPPPDTTDAIRGCCIKSRTPLQRQQKLRLKVMDASHSPGLRSEAQ